MDSLKPDENGKIQGSGLGALFLKQVETSENVNFKENPSFYFYKLYIKNTSRN